MNRKNKEKQMAPLIEQLFETVQRDPKVDEGYYDKNTQTWSHREFQVMSPIKHKREH